MLVVLMRIKVLAEKETELSQALAAMVEEVRKLEGCMNCGLYQDVGKEPLFLWVEKWSNREYREEYIKSNYFGILLGALHILCEQSEIEIMTIHNTELVAVECR